MEPVEVINELWRRISQRDWAGLAALLAPDLHVAWPASGELFVGPSDFVAVQSEYPTGWEIAVLKVVGAGPDVVSEVEVPHSELGAVFRAASFWTVQDGLVTAGTEYWVTVGADEVPAWRRIYGRQQ